MNNNWKELKIDNLPPDILTGDYEFKGRIGNPDRICILEHAKGGVVVYYRKPEPLPPTHEEIMKPRFWQMDNPEYWRAITGVRWERGKTQYLMYDGWCEPDFFTGRQSADIPPEEA